MKQKEKLDLILKKLYESRHESNPRPIHQLMVQLGIYESDEEARRLAKRLADDRLAKVYGSFGSVDIEISSLGIDYCEEDSYSQPGTPATSLYITVNGGIHSTNAVIGGNISHVQQNATATDEVEELVRRIIEGIQSSSQLENEEKTDLIECVSDIKEKLNSGKIVPRLQWRALISDTSNLSAVASLALQLAQLPGFIPPMPTP